MRLAAVLLRIPALFIPKIRLFMTGRRDVTAYLRSFRDPGRDLIWMHTASLGEFEQGLPVLEKLRAEYPGHQFLVTFFSPSGYEVKKHTLGETGVCYLPLDTRRNVRRFLETARPRLALFVKYEVWPNYFRELSRAGIPLLMISALFRSRQAYFRWYGGFMRRALRQVRHFYVQDRTSADLLSSLGHTNVSVSGDTRLDRVLEIRSRDNHLDFMEAFRAGRTCLVAGSTWPEDEAVILPLVNALAGKEFCFVIAPHKTDPKTVGALREALTARTLTYSGMEESAPGAADVLIVDTIGLLTKIYSYAHVAYVGGGFATGLHNTLEPAVFGIPVLIGPRYAGFREAEALVQAGGIRVVNNARDFGTVAEEFLRHPKLREGPGELNADFVQKNAGASVQIASGIRRLIG